MGENSTLFIQAAEVDEFANAIGSQRVINLQAKDYLLSNIENKYRHCLSLEKRHDGYTVTIQGVKNLRIIGHENGLSRLITIPRYADVLKFKNCEDISISRIIFGHEPSGFCTGHVLIFEECSRVKVEKCDLFGSGAYGLLLTKVENLVFRESLVRECTTGIMNIRDCLDINFLSSRFVDNREYHGIGISNSRDVSFLDCQIINNISKDELFSCVSSSGVSVKGGIVQKNSSLKFITDNCPIEVDAVEISNNSWQ